MIPTHYLYLVDLVTGQADAIYPTDHLHSFADLSAYEAELRAAHNLQLPSAAYVLRSSYTAPLSPERILWLIGG